MDFFATIIQDEIARRTRKKLASALRRANFRNPKTLEEFDFTFLSFEAPSEIAFATLSIGTITAITGGSFKPIIDIASKIRKKLENGREARVVYQALSGESIGIPISLIGIKAGLGALDRKIAAAEKQKAN